MAQEWKGWALRKPDGTLWTGSSRVVPDLMATRREAREYRVDGETVVRVTVSIDPEPTPAPEQEERDGRREDGPEHGAAGLDAGDEPTVADVRKPAVAGPVTPDAADVGGVRELLEKAATALDAYAKLAGFGGGHELSSRLRAALPAETPAPAGGVRERLEALRDYCRSADDDCDLLDPGGILDDLDAILAALPESELIDAGEAKTSAVVPVTVVEDSP